MTRSSTTPGKRLEKMKDSKQSNSQHVASKTSSSSSRTLQGNRIAKDNKQKKPSPTAPPAASRNTHAAVKQSSYTQSSDAHHSTHTNYQELSSLDMPPATSWPDYGNVQSQSGISYDLLGLTNASATLSYPGQLPALFYTTGREPALRYSHQGTNTFESPSADWCGTYGLEPMARYIAETPAERSALLMVDEPSRRTIG